MAREHLVKLCVNSFYLRFSQLFFLELSFVWVFFFFFYLQLMISFTAAAGIKGTGLPFTFPIQVYPVGPGN